MAQPICATFPQSSKAKGLLWPQPQTPLPVTATRGPFTEVRLAGLRGPCCANCWHPSFQLPQWPTWRGREGKCSLGGQAGQIRGAMSPLPQINSVFFSFSLLTFFSLFFFFLKKKTNPKTPWTFHCHPDNPQREKGCLESSF